MTVGKVAKTNQSPRAIRMVGVKFKWDKMEERCPNCRGGLHGMFKIVFFLTKESGVKLAVRSQQMPDIQQ